MTHGGTHVSWPGIAVGIFMASRFNSTAQSKSVVAGYIIIDLPSKAHRGQVLTIVVKSRSEIPDTKPDPTGPDTIPVLVSDRSVSGGTLRLGCTGLSRTLHNHASLCLGITFIASFTASI